MSNVTSDDIHNLIDTMPSIDDPDSLPPELREQLGKAIDSLQDLAALLTDDEDDDPDEMEHTRSL